MKLKTTADTDSVESTQDNNPLGPSSRITFPNGNTSKLINVSANAAPDDVLEKMAITAPKALIIISGGTTDFDDHTKSLMYQFCRGINRAACDIHAAIMDSGTVGEGMAIMEDPVGYRRYTVPLIGISTLCRVTYPGASTVDSHQEKDIVPLDPDHSHFILVDTSDRIEEVKLMYRLVDHLIGTDSIPVITVLVNGQDLSRTRLLHSVRIGSPVIVVEGSGGLADQIAELYRRPPDFIEDPELAEIVQEGDIRLFSTESSINALERMISRQVRRDSVLKQAWAQFGVYDLNAIRHQNTFRKIQNAIIWFGVLATALALIQAAIGKDTFFGDILHYPITAVPILVAVLMAAANEFKSGNKWILMRGSAEVLKSHIFSHRAQVETSTNDQTYNGSQETKLAKKLEQISTQLMQTEANLSALTPYNGPLPPMYGTAQGDDGFSRLSPEHYLEARLEDQLGFYTSKTTKIEKRLRRLEWLVYIIGGLGTMLAAFGLELWVALTGSLAAAFGTHMKYEMLQETITKYNQAAMALSNVRTWWISLSASEQADKDNINLLVENTEGILRSEFSSWVEEMQDTITELQKKAGKENETNGEEKKPIESLFIDNNQPDPPKE